MTYAHTQTSKGVLLATFAVLIVVVLFLGLFVQASDDPSADGVGVGVVAVIVVLLLVVVAVMFSRLTVTVDPTEVVAAFGAGWPRRNIALGEITSARRVRNKWWYGWGLRWIPGGWMYNVAGLDAVELQLRSGKVFRIGTDEPDALLAALPRAC